MDDTHTGRLFLDARYFSRLLCVGPPFSFCTVSPKPAPTEQPCTRVSGKTSTFLVLSRNPFYDYYCFDFPLTCTTHRDGGAFEGQLSGLESRGFSSHHGGMSLKIDFDSFIVFNIDTIRESR